MCHNIKTLFNFAPPATDAEIHAASVQFVRKLSGFTKPSQANRVAFDRAVDDVAVAAPTVNRFAGDRCATARPRRGRRSGPRPRRAQIPHGPWPDGWRGGDRTMKSRELAATRDRLQ